jgi:serine/threonine-protein kinase RsbW
VQADTTPEARPLLRVALSVPAGRDYLALARLTAVQVAGLLDLAMSRLFDLRLAVDEACSLLLDAPVARCLELRFEQQPGQLRVTVRGALPQGRLEPDDIGWTVLRALVGDVRMETAGATATLTLIEPLPGRA